jgi:hypothetical protein
MRSMGLELERVLELFFQKDLKQTITHPLPVCSLHCSFTSDPQRTFEALLFAHSLTQK